MSLVSWLEIHFALAATHIISARDELREYVLHVSHANFKGYDDVVQAQTAYMIGYSLGLVEVVDDDDDTASDTSAAPSSAVPRHPNADEVYRALERASNVFLGRKWLVVFRGTRPGVYPSWCVPHLLHKLAP